MKKRAATLILLTVLFHVVAFATQEKKITKLRLTGPGGYLDETTIYFDLGITPAYSMTEDGPKAFGQMQYSPALYTITNDDSLVSTNGYSRLTQSEVVRVGLRTDTAGIYIFSASMVSNFDSTTIIQLEDRQNGAFINLRTDPYVAQFASGQVIDNRFFLHFSKAVAIGTVTAGCSNNDGQLTLAQDNTVTWSNITLRDSLGEVVSAQSSVNGPFNFTGLSEGSYNVTFALGNYSTTKAITLPGNFVTVDIVQTNVQTAVNQPMVVNTTAHNATYYKWEMGDGSQITGIANPEYTYYQPGAYRVTVTASNDAGCEYTDSVTVNVAAATAINETQQNARKIWASDNTITIQLNEEPTQDGEVRVFNVLGQPVYNSSLVQPTTQLQLTSEPTGYYVVQVLNNRQTTTKRLFVAR